MSHPLYSISAQHFTVSETPVTEFPSTCEGPQLYPVLDWLQDHIESTVKNANGYRKIVIEFVVWPDAS